MEKPSERLNWEKFMARHNLIWSKPPLCWEEGAFLGNGLLGLLVYLDPDSQGLTLELGRNDVYDNRDLSSQGSESLYQNPRLPIGKLYLAPKGDIRSFSMELDLYRATLNGSMETEEGGLDFTIYIYADRPFFSVETVCRGQEAENWRFAPAVSESPRQRYGLEHGDTTRIRPNYRPNPPAEVMEKEGQHIILQRISDGAGYVTVWQLRQLGKGSRMYATANIGEQVQRLLDETEAQISALFLEDPVAQYQSHCRWWAEYYQQSFVSLPDRRMESFYWIQMYKAACAARSDALVMDNQGPWLVTTAWPGTWWNLNVQLAYSPLYTANRLSLCESVWRNLQGHLPDLIANVPPHCREDSAAIHTTTTRTYRSDCPPPGKDNGPTAFAEIGNLTWVLHGCWLSYRMTMDQGYLRNFLYPMLRRSISYYLHYLEKREDGCYHLPLTSSPEYHENCEDCNYNLSLLRWGLETLIEISEKSPVWEPMLSRWKEILSHLVDYPQDEDGYLIGSGVKYRKSHRHYSHLLMIYPLHLVSDEDGHEAIIRRSIALWQSLPEQLLGYSFTGAASMYACMGEGDRALESLQRLWSDFLKPNTLYKEAGPVIETPLAAAQTLQEMLLQSWGDRVRVFPAMPDSWRDAAFGNLAAEGGFRVSAQRKDGKTQWIQIESLAGEPLLLQTDIEQLVVAAPQGGMVTVTPLEQEAALERRKGKLYRIEGLKAGMTAVFCPGGFEGKVYPQPLPVDAVSYADYRYGVGENTIYNRESLCFSI